MTAVENVQVVMGITENNMPENTKGNAYQLLAEIGISKGTADRSINRLSGGEQQRVAIARSYSTNVDLLFADEPTGNLDKDKEDEIVNIFQKLAHKHNKCVWPTTHQISQGNPTWHWN